MKKLNIGSFAVYDRLARAYKNAFLAGDPLASVYLESLLDDDFRRMIAKHNLNRGSSTYDRIDRLSDEEYVNVVVTSVFMDRNVLRRWDDENISILGFIDCVSQAHDYIGLAVEKTLNSIRPSYTKNYVTVFTSVTSTQVPAQASRPDGPTVEDELRSGADVAGEAIHDGDLDDESDIARLVQMYIGMSIPEMTIYTLLSECHSRADRAGRLGSIREIVAQFDLDEHIDTDADVRRIYARLRKKIDRAKSSGQYDKCAKIIRSRTHLIAGDDEQTPDDIIKSIQMALGHLVA